jgi:leucyl-tRNA synthetase
MSKSRGNVVVPDHYIEKWGADAFRTYLMFLGPFEEGGDFRDASISGVKRFLDRLWASVLTAVDQGTAGGDDTEVMRKLHQTIQKVGEDIPKLSYNTAVAAMMEYMNALRRGERTPTRAECEPLVQLVAPFAPHIAEELWEKLGHTGSVFDARWPSFDASLAADEKFDLVVQVNGKTRGKLSVARDIDQASAVASAMREESISKFVTGDPKKIIFVPGRLLNIVA